MICVKRAMATPRSTQFDELAHVARPAVAHQHARRLGVDAAHVLARPLRRPRQQAVCDQQDVSAARSERRHLELDHGQAKVEVLAEAPALDRVEEISVGGRHDARVERHLPITAHRTDPSLLQRAKQLGLHLRRHLADLVEEEGAAVRLQQEAVLATHARR